MAQVYLDAGDRYGRVPGTIECGPGQWRGRSHTVSGYGWGSAIKIGNTVNAIIRISGITLAALLLAIEASFSSPFPLGVGNLARNSTSPR